VPKSVVGLRARLVRHREGATDNLFRALRGFLGGVFRLGLSHAAIMHNGTGIAPRPVALYPRNCQVS
jgi:hypothetical protein